MDCALLGEKGPIDALGTHPEGAYYWVQDNARPHEKGKQWLKKQKIHVLEWPAKSPDLNCIEKAWAMMKYERNLTGYAFFGSLRRQVTSLWYGLNPALLGGVVHRFRPCLLALLKNDGFTATKREVDAVVRLEDIPDYS